MSWVSSFSFATFVSYKERIGFDLGRTEDEAALDADWPTTVLRATNEVPVKKSNPTMVDRTFLDSKSESTIDGADLWNGPFLFHTQKKTQRNKKSTIKGSEKET